MQHRLCVLKTYPQRHLDLARTADGFIDGAEGRGRVVKAVWALGRQRWRPHYRKLVVELVLGDVIDGNVEAGRIGQVENIETVLQHDSLGEQSDLGE